LCSGCGLVEAFGVASSSSTGYVKAICPQYYLSSVFVDKLCVPDYSVIASNYYLADELINSWNIWCLYGLNDIGYEIEVIA
jgi:hypothetical protein